MEPTDRSWSGERVALTSFLAMSLLAGGSGVAIRFSNGELDPLWGAGLRFSLAAGLLLAVMACLKLAVPRGRALLGAVLYGSLTFGAGFGLGYYALVQLHAGLAATLLALVPLATVLLAAAQRQERLRPRAILGALVAVAGIAVVTGPAAGDAPPLSLLAAIGSAVCFAEAAVLVRRFPSIHPVTMNAVGMATGAALLMVASEIAGEAIALPASPETWLAVGYLVGLGSVAVFVLYLLVLRHWTASRASYEFVLVPVVTLALSAWLDDEAIAGGLVLGGLLVLAGVYLGALRPSGLRLRRRRPVAVNRAQIADAFAVLKQTK
jgi:drug/metabolite transporter (DMT)-like permease